jgi:hypothetical protein
MTTDLLLPDEGYMPWTLRAAAEWLGEHAEAAKALGWNLSLTGSAVIETFGRDLDVVAVPITADAEDLLAIYDAAANEEGWKTLIAGTSPTGVVARVYEDVQHRLLDITFFPRRPLFAEALLALWEMEGGECNHGLGFEDDCPGSWRGIGRDRKLYECSHNEVREALRAARKMTEAKNENV